jgi:hypothetical protein
MDVVKMTEKLTALIAETGSDRLMTCHVCRIPQQMLKVKFFFSMLIDLV